MADAPIGIFDSGFGGLTVARAVIDQLPHESVLYLGDTARQPYGPKPIGEVREYALECLDHLVEQGVKMLVIACNSASAAVLRDARERYDVPVVEVILPATRRAVAATHSGKVGVICTRATAQSQAYEDAFAAAPQIDLTTQACPRFVGFVEEGVTGGPELLAVAHEYLDPLVADGVDTLVLGCTHYPLLTGVISYVMGENVTLVSSAEECAKDVYRVLTERGLEQDPRTAKPVHRFLTTGQPEEFEQIGRRFLGPELDRVRSSPAGQPTRGAGGALMRMTVVGCSGSYPGPDSPASSYLLEAEQGGRTWRIVLDLGNGALGALQRYADPLAIDAVLLSHLHADHCIDLTSYYVLRKYHPTGPRPPIPVYGPDGTPGRLARAYDLPKSPGMREEFAFHYFPGEPFSDRPVHDHRGGGLPSGAGVCDADRGRRADADLLRGHRAVPGPGCGCPPRGPVLVRGVLRGRAGQPARPAPHRGRGRRDGDSRRGAAGRADPRAAVARRRGDPARGGQHLRRPARARRAGQDLRGLSRGGRAGDGGVESRGSPSTCEGGVSRPPITRARRRAPTGRSGPGSRPRAW